MNCEQFRTARLGDDPGELREAERHAAECTRCAGLLSSDRELADAVAAWKAAAPGPPEHLRTRIADTLREHATRARAWPGRSRSRSRAERVGWFAVAAALLLVALTFALTRRTDVPDTTHDFAATLERIDRIAADYAGAIAELEARAEPVLARAGDPEVRPVDAALLLSYRDRLSNLDAVILEVQSYLEEHPGHAGGHTVLLAAYEEKKEVLAELLALRIGESS